MKVFSILVATCLVGLCHCKGSRFPTDRLFIEVLDDYAEDEIVTTYLVEGVDRYESSAWTGKRLVWDLANGSVYEEGYRPSLARRHTNDRRVADVAVEDSSALTHSRHDSPIAVNLVSPDKDECEFFDYSFAGNAVQLIVPKDGVSISKLMNGKEEVYTLSSGEKFDHAKLFLNKDGKAELVLVVAKTSTKVKETYLEFKDGKWIPCGNHGEKMLSLRVPAERTSDIDLSLKTSTDQCTIFETDLLGLTTKHFYPKPGLVATQVKDGDEELWSTSDRSNRCLYCLIYKRGDKEVLEMIVVENSSGRGRYFERVNGEWNPMTEEDYDQKLADMKGTFAGQSSVEEYKEYLDLISTTTPPSGQYGFETPQFIPPLADYSRQPSFSPSDPQTLDLASLTDPRYKVVDVDIAGIPARVYLVGPKEDINKVNYSGKDVWKASRFSEGEDGYNTTPEEICTYCITFIKGTGTAMILVEIHDLSIYREIFRYKQKTGSNGNESGWERSPTEYGKKIDALKINTDPPKKFTLDISSLEEGDEKFKLVKENKNDITTLFFATKQGYSIEKVVDGGKEICVLNESFGSFLCEVHSKGDHGLMRVHAEQRYIITFGWYEKKNSKWTDIKEKEFFKKLDEMRGVPNNASKSNTTHQLGGP